MNVVGKVGSLISQGVYSVATPFHPFGGAVDIIVVQQQDGTFRSTPWYVRFGKFQGVLKGSEKIVGINVNDVDANFHMCLDNSGEAYFTREIVENTDTIHKLAQDKTALGEIDIDGSEETVVDISKLNSSISDLSVIELHNIVGLKRAESDVSRIFYEFEDDPSSHGDSPELSEYGSNRYESFEGVDPFVESQDSDSEVILFSVDGHVLTAPISPLEDNITENVQLCTPQFHLGPGKGTNVCEENLDFVDPNYIIEQTRANDGSIGHRLEVCEEADGNVFLSEEANEQNNTEDESGANVKKKDIFKSCLKLPEMATHIKHDIALSVPAKTDDLDDPSSNSIERMSVIECINGLPPSDESEATEKNAHGSKYMESDSSVSIDYEGRDDLLGTEKVDAKSESMGLEAATSNEGIQTDINIGFEISLCGNKLRLGMGLSAANDVFNEQRISEEEFKHSAALIIKDENLIVRYRERYLRWEKASQVILGMAAFGVELPVEDINVIPIERDEIQNKPKTPIQRWRRLWSLPFGRVKTPENSKSNLSNDDVFVDSEPTLHDSKPEQTTSLPSVKEARPKQLLKTHIPTNEQITSLNLKEGQNIIAFSFSTRVLGPQQVDAHIYLWKWNARIVISDVDGTITKSDVLGQFMPLVGRDWTQSGVAHLFCAIKENGYQLLFLSARAIVQAYLTRSFLLNLKQDGKTLPSGPVVISPDGLFPSLFREVIRRAPHEFKIACLEDIKSLFPADYNPFYAGFGNRDTDELSYRKIGIPKGKIFIINPKGEVAINHRIDVKSYTSLHTLVNDMFPPTTLSEQEDFNSWNFWRVPLPDIDI